MLRKKERFRAIKAELSQTSLKFHKTTLRKRMLSSCTITDQGQLKGLPQSQIEQAETAAQEKKIRRMGDNPACPFVCSFHAILRSTGAS